MPNPIIAEVTRGGIVESRHTGAFAVVNRNHETVLSAGDIEAPVFPRSTRPRAPTGSCAPCRERTSAPAA